MGFRTHAQNAREVSGKTLLLASQSPRRLQLLRQLGLDPICLPIDIDETALPEETAKQLVLRLARLKAQAGQAHPDFSTLFGSVNLPVVLAADTVVELDGEILTKPVDESQGVWMLQRLSDREHHVISGVCVAESSGEPDAVMVSTAVKFSTITPEIARRYWHSGEPQGKAGGYAIQGIGAQFVESIVGSYSNVVGLPLFETSRLLESAKITSI